MKKILLTLGILFCLCKLYAQPISVPGSSFPIVSAPSNTWRIIGLDTNGASGGTTSLTRSNWTITWGGMVSLLTSIINPSFPWLIVTNGSSTATIQAQFNSLTNGGVIAVQSGSPFLTTATIMITNKPLIIFADGATFRYADGLTNAMFSTGTNYGGNLVIYNMRFDGGTYLNYNNSNYFHLEPRNPLANDVNPYFNPFWTNRTALSAEVSGGVTINDCYFYGWSGNAQIFMSSKTSQQYIYPKLIFQGNHCYSNFMATLMVNSAEDVKGYYNNDITGVGAWTCEYALLTHNDYFANYIGIGAAPGNCVIDQNFIDENWIALWFGYTTGNGAHGRYNNNSFNHNNFAVWAAYQPAFGVMENNFFGRNGQDLQAPAGTNIYYPNGSTSGLHFENCQGIHFANNKLSIEWLTFSNNCRGIFANNTYGGLNYAGNQGSILGGGDSNLVWGANGPKTNFSDGIRIYGNVENLALQNDNSMGAILALATNSAAVGAIPYATDGTNYGAWTTQIGITTNGSMYFNTNATIPFPVSGKVIWWYSNYDGWIITPTKTNRIFQGQ